LLPPSFPPLLGNLPHLLADLEVPDVQLAPEVVGEPAVAVVDAQVRAADVTHAQSLVRVGTRVWRVVGRLVAAAARGAVR
jgi:hypothetical protein